MKELIAYPNVPPERVLEIYEQSRQEPIHGYGFFIELMSAYHKENPVDTPNRSIEDNDDPIVWMETLKDRLVAAGLHRSYVADYPTLPKYRIGDYCEDGWLIVLGTGFNKKLHTPLEDGLVERIQEIVGTNRKPSWFTMKKFSYPNPKAWNTCVARRNQLLDQKKKSSTMTQ